MGTKRLDTLGELARHGVNIPVLCRKCRRFVEVSPSPLALRFGWGRWPEDVPWRCSACGARGKAVAVGRAARLDR